MHWLSWSCPTSAHLQEQDAFYANKKGYSRHKPALPLYTVADAERALSRLRPFRFREPLALDGINVTWRPAGHLLGSAILEAEVAEPDHERVVFSGDLGRFDNEVMKPPEAIESADTLVVESTYGDRLHAEQSIASVLGQALEGVAERRGVLLIPAFAVGRTQQILYHIRKLQDQGIGGGIPVFVDSPMAVDASQIYCRFGDDHNLSVNLLMDEDACPLRCRETHFVREVAESKALNEMPGPAVIISASGMLTGGRILHHLKWRLPDEKNILLFVGYQAAGTRGRLLLEGASDIRIHGQQVPVRARLVRLDALSGHADQGELTRWMGEFKSAPARVFLVHGEPHASQALKARLERDLGWKASVPEEGGPAASG